MSYGEFARSFGRRKGSGYSGRRPRTIRTRRMVLEAVAPKHADELWMATQASLAELRPWLAWAIQPTADSSRMFAFSAADDWENMTAWNFALIIDGMASGTISLHNYIPALQRAEMGYWLRSDLCGRGLMTEAASAVVEFGFDHVNLHRIELHAGIGNYGSARVAEKLGFAKEGVLRHASRGANGWYDVFVYSLLDDDPRHVLHR